jgi:hypothetical protein
MQQHLTIISGICGLIIIFIAAAINPNHFKWVTGVFAVLAILYFRISLGEVRLKTELQLTAICWLGVIATILFLV